MKIFCILANSSDGKYKHHFLVKSKSFPTDEEMIKLFVDGYSLNPDKYIFDGFEIKKFPCYLE